MNVLKLDNRHDRTEGLLISNAHRVRHVREDSGLVVQTYASCQILEKKKT